MATDDDKRDELPPLRGKQAIWLKHFTDIDNPKTFNNRTESTYAAGYAVNSRECASQIGSQNFRKLKAHISKWLNEAGLTPDIIKLGILDGMNAHVTKFAMHEGKITDERECIDYPTRAKFHRLAIDVQGMAVNKHQISGPGGGPVGVQLGVDDLAAEMMSQIASNQEGRKHQLPNEQEMIDPDETIASNSADSPEA